MNVRCLLRGHEWGPLKNEQRVTFHTCTRCGKTKTFKGVGGGPNDDQRYLGHGPDV